MAKFQFLIDDDRNLERARRLTNRGSQAEVVRDAITFYEYALRRILRGEKFYVRKGKKYRKLEVSTFRTAQAKLTPPRRLRSRR